MFKFLIQILIFIWGSFSLSLYISDFAPEHSVLMYFAITEQYSDIIVYDTGFHMSFNLTDSPYPEWRGTWSEVGLFAYTANASSRENAMLFLSQDLAPATIVEAVHDELIFDATLSPDGRKLLFVSSEPANYSEIFLVDLRLGEQINLSQTPDISESEPQWLNNDWLVYLREGNIYAMEIATQESFLLLDATVLIENILLSPDRQMIAYHGMNMGERQLYLASSNRNLIPYVGQPAGERGLYLSTTQALYPTRIPLPRPLSTDPLSWSPDSQALVFTLDDGSLNIYEIGTQSLLSYSSPNRRINPLWSTDGQTIAFMENRRLFLLDWETGDIMPLDETRLIRPPFLWLPKD
jgi:Tol biopolymer transport system component